MQAGADAAGVGGKDGVKGEAGVGGGVCREAVQGTGEAPTSGQEEGLGRRRQGGGTRQAEEQEPQADNEGAQGGPGHGTGVVLAFTQTKRGAFCSVSSPAKVGKGTGAEVDC